MNPIKIKIKFKVQDWNNAFQPFAGYFMASKAYRLFIKDANLMEADKAIGILRFQCAFLNARCVGTLYRDRNGSSFVNNGKDAIAHWIDVGDSESLTLCYIIASHEFIISNLADLIERFNLTN